MISRKTLVVQVNFITPRLVTSVARTTAAALIMLFALAISSAPLFAVGIHALELSALRSQQPPNCLDLIVNGGFEQTAVGWESMAGASLFTYATGQSVSGQHALLLGTTTSENITATFGVEQLITLPAASTSIEFSFYYEIDLEGEAGPGDQAYLTIHDAATNQLLAMLVLSPTHGEWSMGRYDLTPLADNEGDREIRLAFSTQNDDEPGKLTMLIDDVALVACLPPETFALQPLPTATPSPTPLAPLPLVPLPSPTAQPAAPPSTPSSSASAGSSATSATAALVPEPQGLVTPSGWITSLDACNCSSGQYACSDFANWSIAQACFTQCQVTAGYDIHNLDADRNGIACELELQDVAPLDATPSPQATPSTVTETQSVSASAPVSVTRAVSVEMPIAGSADGSADVSGDVSGTLPSAQAPVNGAVVVSPVVTTATSTNAVSSVANSAASSSVSSTVMDATTTVTGSDAITAPAASAAVALAESAPPIVVPNDPASALSTLEMLSLLLFSPLGYLAVGVLAVIGLLSLWVAYMVGQRSKAIHEPPVNNLPSDNLPTTSR